MQGKSAENMMFPGSRSENIMLNGVCYVAKILF